MKTIALLMLGLAAATMSSTGFAREPGADAMTREDYAEYLRLFNDGDERYADYYHEDVVFHHAPMFGVLKGRQAIIDFYRNIRTQLNEHVTAHAVVIDADQNMMAAELSTRLVAVRDGVKMPSGDLDTGDAIVSEGTVYYTLKDGLISVIRGSRSGAQKMPANTAER